MPPWPTSAGPADRTGSTWSVFDLGDLSSVRRGADELLDRCPRIDVLVNNAGLVLSERTETVDGFEATLRHQPPGPVPADPAADRPPGRVGPCPRGQRGLHGPPVRPPRPGLRRPPVRAATTAACEAYGRSKLANILFTTELARRLAGTGVTANSLHPGTVATGYARDGDAKGFLAFGIRLIKPFILTPEQGARTSVYLSSSPEVADVTGRYFVKCRPRTPSPAAQDEAAATLLWSVSEELVERAAPRSA